MIALESIVIAVLGALLGVVLGIGFGVALMYSLRDEGLEVIAVPVGQLVVFLVLSVVDRRAGGVPPGPTCGAPRRTPRDRDRVTVPICGRPLTMRFDGDRRMV